MKKNKIIIGLVALVAIIAIFAGVYAKFGPKTQQGEKAVVLEVVDDQGKKVSYELQTDAEYLEQVMEEAKEQGFTYEGSQGEYGLTVTAVNGLTADYNNGGAYWAFYVNDEYCNYGPSEQPVADGDTFSIRYEVWNAEE